MSWPSVSHRAEFHHWRPALWVFTPVMWHCWLETFLLLGTITWINKQEISNSVAVKTHSAPLKFCNSLILHYQSISAGPQSFLDHKWFLHYGLIWITSVYDQNIIFRNISQFQNICGINHHQKKTVKRYFFLPVTLTEWVKSREAGKQRRSVNNNEFSPQEHQLHPEWKRGSIPYSLSTMELTG